MRQLFRKRRICFKIRRSRSSLLPGAKFEGLWPRVEFSTSAENCKVERSDASTHCSAFTSPAVPLRSRTASRSTANSARGRGRCCWARPRRAGTWTWPRLRTQSGTVLGPAGRKAGLWRTGRGRDGPARAREGHAEGPQGLPDHRPPDHAPGRARQEQRAAGLRHRHSPARSADGRGRAPAGVRRQASPRWTTVRRAPSRA